MIVSFVTASGAPGATTTALGLALNWPRPVLVVENAVGSPILAGYCRGTLAHDRGMLSLLAGQRDNALAAALEVSTVELSGSNVHLLPGFTSHGQIGDASADLWQDLAPLLRSISQAGTDVFIDAGRYGAVSFPRSILPASDHIFLMTRTDLASVVCATRSVPPMSAVLQQVRPGCLQALTIGGRAHYSPSAVAEILGIPLGADLPLRAMDAKVFSEGAQPPRKFGSSPLWLALAELETRINKYELSGMKSYV
jgi:hypothetical protein